jgi:membrane-bound metal-dependent hydrolase YbcI (DUF457 family)
MGFIIQLLLAVALGDFLGRKHLGKWALLFGAGCSILIDLPSFFHDPIDTYGREHAHDWSHSFFGIILYTLCITGLAFLRKQEPIVFIRIAVPIFITHLLFDISNTNGAPLLFPFFDDLINIQGISRFDPIIGLPLGLSFLLTYRKARTKWSKRALFFVLCYTLSSHGLSLQARYSIAPMLIQMGFPENDIQITNPTFFPLLRRVSVKDEDDRYAITYFSPFSSRPPRVFVKQSIHNPQIDSLLQSSLGQRLVQISSSMIFIKRIENRYIFSDIRFGGFTDPWESSLHVQSILEKGSAQPLEYLYFYPKTPLFDDLQEGWKFLFP